MQDYPPRAASAPMSPPSGRTSSIDRQSSSGSPPSVLSTASGKFTLTIDCDMLLKPYSSASSSDGSNSGAEGNENGNGGGVSSDSSSSMDGVFSSAEGGGLGSMDDAGGNVSSRRNGNGPLPRALAPGGGPNTLHPPPLPATSSRVFTSKTGPEAAQFFQLAALLNVALIHRIKIKCIHSCGGLRVQSALVDRATGFTPSPRGAVSPRGGTTSTGFSRSSLTSSPEGEEEDPCLDALWELGDWFVEGYRMLGRVARYEDWKNGGSDGVGGGRELDEPDAVLTVWLEGSGDAGGMMSGGMGG